MGTGGEFGAEAVPEPKSVNCGPEGGELMADPPSWQQLHRVCQVQAAEGACIPAAIEGYAEPLCISQDGAATCVPPFTEPAVHFRGVADMRGCEACSCLPVVTSCQGTVVAYADTMCAAADEGAVPTDGACHVVSLRAFQSYTLDVDDPVESCTPGTATPAVTGSVVSQEPLTVCCMPSD